MALQMKHLFSYEVPADGISKWSTGCSGCKDALPPLIEIASEYFETNGVICLKCGASTDIWRSMQESAREDAYGITDLVGFGASSLSFNFPLSAGERQEIYFPSLGIPEDAIILHLTCTANGGPSNNCFPVEISHFFLPQRFHGSKATIYGLPQDPNGQSIVVWGSVTWMHNEDDSEPWLLLADAFEATLLNKPSKILVPAHSAVEITISGLIREVLLKYISRDQVDTFMVDNLTSSAAANVMLPFVCAHLGIKPLSLEIIGKLNRLRKLRNSVAHKGTTVIENKEAKELLCAAVFALEFVRHARKMINIKTAPPSGLLGQNGIPSTSISSS